MYSQVEDDAETCLYDCCLKPVEVGQGKASWPVDSADPFIYYVYWLIGGWWCGAHRLYLGELAVSLALAGSFMCGVIVLLVWLSVYAGRLSGSTDTSIFVVQLGFFLIVFVVWVYDGFLGAYLVERYKVNVYTSHKHQIIALKQAQIQRDINEKTRELRLAFVSNPPYGTRYRGSHDV